MNMNKIVAQGCDIAMGIDAGKSKLVVTAMAEGGVIVKQASLQHTRSALESFLRRFPDCNIRVVYEAGCFGYWLYDTLTKLGVMTIVTPPSKVLRARGDKVKTDLRDSVTLAGQLQAGLLLAVAVPSMEERATRQLVRTYEQLKRTRVQAMVRIRSFLEFHHIRVPAEAGNRWTRAFLNWLETFSFDTPSGEYLRRSLDELLKTYRGLTEQVNDLKKEIGRLAKTKPYQRAVHVLEANSGVGTLSAMIILTEARNVRRFETSQQFASYLGLTPSEHSTSETRRQGHITKAGSRRIRGILIECAWAWIRKDKAAYAAYKRLARRREPKRAIVAMARHLAVKIYWQLKVAQQKQSAA